ncbi:MAG: hypothetical protein Q4B31_02420 [Clostridia bacterium]|nr:hypothetical protein [Clostridia bacterium]
MKYLLYVLAIVMCFWVNPILGAIVLTLALLYLVFMGYPKILAIKGNAAFSSGDTEKALRLYKKAAMSANSNAKTRTTYAVLLLRSGAPESAEKEFTRVVSSGLFKAEEKNYAKQYRAMAYYKLGNLKDAIDDAKEVYSTTHSTQIYSVLGFLMTVSGEAKEDILAFCEEAYEYNSDERDIIDNLVVALTLNGELIRAKELAQKLTEEQPGFVEGFYHLAVICKMQGDIDGLKKAAEGLKDTNRSYMTTVTEEEVNSIITEAENA